MPLQRKDRHTAEYTRLSTVKNSPRATLAGRSEPSPRFVESNSTPAASQYQSLYDWSNPTNKKGPRIGAQSLGPGGRMYLLDPQTMIGATLRSKSLGVPQYDPQPGMGEYNKRKPAAVMTGAHTGRAAAGSASGSSSAAAVADNSATPGPNNYASEYDNIGSKAHSLRVESARAGKVCRFGGRLKDPHETSSSPGPGAYDQDYTRAMSPLQPDPENPRKTKRPSSMSGSFDSSKGKSFGGRCGGGARWSQGITRPDDTPGPSEYSPRLPFIGSANARVASVKGRLEHPFCDKLAAHECARSDFNHQQRGAKRFKAKVRL